MISGRKMDIKILKSARNVKIHSAIYCSVLTQDFARGPEVLRVEKNIKNQIDFQLMLTTEGLWLL